MTHLEEIAPLEKMKKMAAAENRKFRKSCGYHGNDWDHIDTMGTVHERIADRRKRVMEMMAQGFDHWTIAKKLEVSPEIINSDMIVIRKQE